MISHPHYNAPLEGSNRGRGIAVGYRFNGGGSGSSATLNVNANGTVNLITGSADLSGTRVAIAMQAAEVLGLSAEDVTPTVVDTDSVGYTGGSGGSRITFDTGRAVLAAAEQVIRQMSARAALLWEVRPEDVEFKDAVFTCTRNQEDRMTFKELAGMLMDTGGPITCSASDKQGGVGAQLAGNIVDVEVDRETGKVDILRYTAFVDAGRAVHPGYVEGQMQGGVLQGVGWALNEEYYYTEDGVMANSTFLDYRMPTTLDLPMIDTVIVEVPNPPPPVRSAWGRGGPNRAAAGRHGQCRLPRRRRAYDKPAHVPRRHPGSSRGENRRWAAIDTGLWHGHVSVPASETPQSRESWPTAQAGSPGGHYFLAKVSAI